MVDVDAMVGGSKLGLVEDLGRKHPFCSGIFGADFAEKFCNSQISKPELCCTSIAGIQFVSRMESEYICSVYVLVGVPIQVKKLHRLEKRTRNRHCPYRAFKPIRRKQFRHRDFTPFGDDVADVAILEGIVEVGNLRVAEFKESLRFC